MYIYNKVKLAHLSYFTFLYPSQNDMPKDRGEDQGDGDGDGKSEGDGNGQDGCFSGSERSFQQFVWQTISVLFYAIFSDTYVLLLGFGSCLLLCFETSSRTVAVKNIYTYKIFGEFFCFLFDSWKDGMKYTQNV